jgi:hypothetical protein
VSVNQFLAERFTPDNVLDSITKMCAEWHAIENGKALLEERDDFQRAIGKLWGIESSLAFLMDVERSKIRTELKAGRL